MEDMLKLPLAIWVITWMIVQGDKTKEATRVILGGEWFHEQPCTSLLGSEGESLPGSWLLRLESGTDT